MARSIGDVPQFTTYSTQYNLTELPFRITFSGGTVSASQLPFGMTFSSKTATGIYRFNVPACVATKYWVNARNTGNTIISFPSADSLIPTGLLDIQFGTTAATTATDPADGVVAYGVLFESWGK